MLNYAALLNIPADSAERTDLLVRLMEREAGTGRYQVRAVAETKSVSGRIWNILAENVILKAVLTNQWNLYKYNLEYNSYLLGTVTHEEFLRRVRRYARQFQQIDRRQLELAASIIIDTLGQSVSSADLSELLNVDPSDIETALRGSSLVQIASSGDESE